MVEFESKTAATGEWRRNATILELASVMPSNGFAWMVCDVM